MRSCIPFMATPYVVGVTTNLHRTRWSGPYGARPWPPAQGDCHTQMRECLPGIGSTDCQKASIIIMPYSIYWNQQFTASEYAFDTTRKSGEIAAAIAAGRVEVTL